MDFRKQVLELVNVPVGRIAFRTDKWGLLATVYFNGITKPESIGDDADTEDWEDFLHYVKRKSAVMVGEAEKCYGENWREYIKARG